MSNILSQKEKLIIRKEYRMRVFAVTLAFILASILLAIILLIPSFILTLYKGKAVVDLSTKVPERVEDLATFNQKLEAAKKITAVLTPETVSYTPTAIIDVILKTKTSGNSVTSITYEKAKDNVVSISVKGEASTRIGLLDFTRALEKQPRINKIDLPVSSFAKDTDIPYTFDIHTTQ